jgi:hypothetical protein
MGRQLLEPTESLAESVAVTLLQTLPALKLFLGLRLLILIHL